MKKTRLYIFVFLTSIFGVKETHAQSDFNKKKQHYIVLTKKTEQLNPIILAAKALALEDGEKHGEFHIVVCGKTVEDLINTVKMKPLITMANQQDVKLFACGFSLKKFNINAQELPHPIKVVENGILYHFQLQKKGFKSITL
ncbi:DsrE family protein [Mariniflexile ostreae]|uniref:DsrE family protein n=1 Tax=Mariniflexile ostreae TaxID=1520892 RepID=A0ABV5F9N1_9FLAO